jgi:hypothetical protein
MWVGHSERASRLRVGEPIDDGSGEFRAAIILEEVPGWGESLVRLVGRAGDAVEERLLQSAKHDVAGYPLNDCH